MTPDDDATTVRVPIALRRIFDGLTSHNKWLNFADFSREAIREKLTQEKRLQSWRDDEAPSEADHPRSK